MKRSDAESRVLALDPFKSFAISAPAGSGKTELLTQRMLGLLCVVNNPEEIMCMTFTNKAVDEMKGRVMHYLIKASEISNSNFTPSSKDHQNVTLDLAKKALFRNKEKKWGLLENPSRLRIHTIDGFCRKLAMQLPIESCFDRNSEDLENPSEIYKEVTSEFLLAKLENNDAMGFAISTLLTFLDNDLDVLQKLLIKLLGDRGQSIAHLYQTQKGRAYLESSLIEVVEETLSATSLILKPYESELIELVNYAATNLSLTNDMNTDISSCIGLTKLPEVTSSKHRQWLGLIALLLTGEEKTWRKGINKTIGFPTSIESIEDQQEARNQAKLKKESLSCLIDRLKAVPELHEALCEAILLPPSCYDDDQWEILNALSSVLPMLSAHLTLALQKKQVCDYPEVTLAALRALGTEEAPTELALKLDYSIKHILMDEFQDTSSLQFDLLKRLTSEWCPNDDRSLFIVGDPMQCLYTWRGANVGQFIQARTLPIGNIQLEALDLQINFRSQPGIIKWVNHAFKSAFPDKDDISRGSIRYNPSTANIQEIPIKTEQSHQAVTIDEFIGYEGADDSKILEASHITSLVCKAKERNSEGSIAILTRSRNSLSYIISSLQKAGLSWQATEMDSLSNRMPVVDLKSLTRAMISPADRVAWLSIMRAPWCGLDLNDLFLIANHKAPKKNKPLRVESFPLVMSNVFEYSEIPGISKEGKQILHRCSAVLKKGWRQRYRKPFRVWIESIWIELGGINSLASSKDFDCCGQYFDLLEQHEKNGQISDWAVFENSLKNIYTRPSQQSDPNLHIMTIHKAKGLEFDTVIIPSLNRPSGNDSESLILWHERSNKKGKTRLIIGPKHKTGKGKDPLFEYLKKEKKLGAQLETLRTIYVGATRAVKQLHLTYTINIKKDSKEKPKPLKNTLLSALAGNNYLEDYFKTISSASFHSHISKPISENKTDGAGLSCLSYINRLPADWKTTAIYSQSETSLKNINKEFDVDKLEFFTLNSTIARHTGTVLHRILRQLVVNGINCWDANRIHNQTSFWRSQLQNLGLINYDQPLDLLKRAVLGCLKDKDNHWIFESTHKESKCEFAIGYQSSRDSKPKTSIIDRCFILNKEQWIIDYKSTEPQKNESLDVFLKRETLQYQGQLKHYASLLNKMNGLPSRKALYFPLIQHLEEI